ncbi:uncharacterized protein PAC_05711 [Phialocephala subalpina]|uniref:Tat pathway signal sequence n=1 Tax=Phialocephala subalpina TaxID=576137 RepID=A0A1L7WST1_9HELO|nr:uncharacterized protein PAC_05711 [Phialocephala subalpina]
MFSFMRGPDFKRLPADEESESFIKERRESVDDIRAPPVSILSRPLLSFFLLLLLPVAALFGAKFGGSWVINADRLSIDHISNYSPLLEDIDITYSTVHFNGTLLHENMYRQSASPAVDEAWQALGVDYRAAIIPSHLASKSGLLESQVQVADQYGGGYPANVEGLHHLHCLNLLRQSLYFNFDYYKARGEGAFINSERILRLHVIDIGVLGQVWWNRDSPSAYPDFDTKHKCRNFEEVRKWAFEHQAPEEVRGDYLKAPRDGDVREVLP